MILSLPRFPPGQATQWRFCTAALLEAVCLLAGFRFRNRLLSSGPSARHCTFARRPRPCKKRKTYVATLTIPAP